MGIMTNENDFDELEPRKVEKVYDAVKVNVGSFIPPVECPKRYCYACGKENGVRFTERYDTGTGKKITEYYCSNSLCYVDCEHKYNYSWKNVWGLVGTSKCLKCGQC